MLQTEDLNECSYHKMITFQITMDLLKLNFSFIFTLSSERLNSEIVQSWLSLSGPKPRWHFTFCIHFCLLQLYVGNANIKLTCWCCTKNDLFSLNRPSSAPSGQVSHFRPICKVQNISVIVGYNDQPLQVGLKI